MFFSQRLEVSRVAPFLFLLVLTDATDIASENTINEKFDDFWFG
jgi:hypothetical protein